MKHYVIITLLLSASFNQALHSQDGKNFIIGALSGCTATFFTEPLVYLKNCLQQQKSISKNPFHWWRGLPINASGAVPMLAVQNMAYQHLRKKLETTNLDTTPKELVAACGAGICSSFITCPRELLIIHQQNDGGNIYNISKRFINQYGLKNVWRGIFPGAIRTCSFSSCLFVLTPKLKKNISEYTENKIAQETLPGLTAGAFSALITHPFDTIKTHMQAHPHSGNTRQTICSIFYGEPTNTMPKKGISAFYKGLLPRMAGVSLSMLIVSVTKDLLSRHLIQ